MRRYSVDAGLVIGKSILLALLIIFPAFLYSQPSGSGKCLAFNGVDNYVDLGDIYDDLYPPFTISAWIFLDESAEGWAPVFASQDNSAVYKGTVFLVSKDQVGIEYGDGRGWNNPQFRRSKGANVGDITNRWIHVAGVIRDATDMDLFINGLNVQGTYSGTTPYPMVNKKGDVAKIGAWYSNNQRFWFKGKIDELRVWNYSRSEEEVRSDMCKKLQGNEAGLIGYWRFDEETGSEVIDHSGNNFNGELKNGLGRTISGASLGDYSIHNYSNNFTGQSLSIGVDNEEHLMVSNISSNSRGVQLYRVDDIPDDLSGIGQSDIAPPYFGLFVCNYTTEAIDYDLTIRNSCKSYFRENNSDTPWEKIESDENDSFVVYDHRDRSEEVINVNGQSFSLGSDRILCPGESILFEVENSNYEKIEWSTGSFEDKVLINNAGVVWAKIYSECGVTVDSVNVLLSSEPSVDLGSDMEICTEGVALVVESSSGQKVTWQDGSSDSVFIVKSPGTYWVQVENQCGIDSDTVKISRREYSNIFLPNVVTANGDQLNDKFYIDEQIIEAQLTIYNRWGREVFSSEGYNNDWPKELVNSGIYYYHLTDHCSKRSFKGLIHVIN